MGPSAPALLRKLCDVPPSSKPASTQVHGFCPRPPAAPVMEELLPADCLPHAAPVARTIPPAAEVAELLARKEPERAATLSEEAGQLLFRNAATAFASLWAAAREEAASSIQRRWRCRQVKKPRADGDVPMPAAPPASLLQPSPPTAPLGSRGDPRRRMLAGARPTSAAAATATPAEAPAPPVMPAAPSAPRPARAGSRPVPHGVVACVAARGDEGAQLQARQPQPPAQPPTRPLGARRPGRPISLVATREVQMEQAITKPLEPRPAPGPLRSVRKVGLYAGGSEPPPAAAAAGALPTRLTAMELDLGLQPQVAPALPLSSSASASSPRISKAPGMGLLPELVQVSRHANSVVWSVSLNHNDSSEQKMATVSRPIDGARSARLHLA